MRQPIPTIIDQVKMLLTKDAVQLRLVDSEFPCRVPLHPSTPLNGGVYVRQGWVQRFVPLDDEYHTGRPG